MFEFGSDLFQFHNFVDTFKVNIATEFWDNTECKETIQFIVLFSNMLLSLCILIVYQYDRFQGSHIFHIRFLPSSFTDLQDQSSQTLQKTSLCWEPPPDSSFLLRFNKVLHNTGPWMLPPAVTMTRTWTFRLQQCQTCPRCVFHRKHLKVGQLKTNKACERTPRWKIPERLGPWRILISLDSWLRLYLLASGHL